MASKVLSKQIIIEILALIFLIFAIIYSSYAIKKSEDNEVNAQDGMVTVLENNKLKELKIASDGEGLLQDGITYTVTNNNEEVKKYNLVISSNIHNEEVLKHIKVGINDIAVYNLIDLQRDNGVYVLTTYELKAGYTKVHLIKLWFDLDSDSTILNKNINFDFNINLI